MRDEVAIGEAETGPAEQTNGLVDGVKLKCKVKKEMKTLINKIFYLKLSLFTFSWLTIVYWWPSWVISRQVAELTFAERRPFRVTRTPEK